ncbi:hypothetical protein KUTeg_024150 [Tegillarca granosa]|uniref:Uncharacterized protein n=1 Tax=Tegillarca granosa TaxID=220873 RepID=A0ABQ9DWH6_TEGGR|nr:hypothetical protein KUTeg_024150 [Tegillarca granosa]
MASKKININTADVEHFENLRGVGHCKAEAIVKHRKSIGGFSEVNDLSKVPGVGHGIVELNRGSLSCIVASSTRSRRNTRGRRSRNELPEPVISSSSPKPCSSSSSSTNSNNGPSKFSLRLSTGRKTRSTVDSPDVSTSTVSKSSVSATKDSVKQEVPVKREASDPVSVSAGSKSNVNQDEECLMSDDGDGDVQNLSEDEQLRSSDDDRDTPEFRHVPLVHSDVSSLRNASPFYRSRIPVPVLMKRKIGREDVGIIPGKRFCTGGYSGTSTFGNLRLCHQIIHNGQRPRIPSKEHPPARLAEWLEIFQSWGNAERLMALDELIQICEPTQVRHMMQVIEPQFQRDFISLLPKECLRTLVGHTGGVWSSQMAGNIVISGSTDRTLKVWNADTGQCIHTLYGHTSTVRCMHLHDNV